MRHAKVDQNHAQIVEAFRSLGCSVLSLADLGKGVPDLIVAKRGITWLIEVKSPKGKLTPDQETFAETWAGCRAIVRDLEGVEDVVETMKEQAKNT